MDVDPGSKESVYQALHHDDNGKVDFTEGVGAQKLIAGEGTSSQENLLMISLQSVVKYLDRDSYFK